MSKGIARMPPTSRPPPPLQVTFNKAQRLAREVTLPGHPDLSLTISEPLNGAKTHVLPVKVSARALFNRCSITPARGINFGPLQYSTSSKPRCVRRSSNGAAAAPTQAGQAPAGCAIRLTPSATPPLPPPVPGASRSRTSASSP